MQLVKNGFDDKMSGVPLFCSFYCVDEMIL